jgi:FkbM family methyltransferase
MKNVMIYNRLDDNLRYTDEVLINTLKAQVDNSIRMGWDVNDIIIGTNFDFEYRGVKNKPLNNVCRYNPFVNKFYGMLELMETGVLTEDFWFHDQDNWQVTPFEFPEFTGEIAGCTYVATGEWNTASLFVKKTAKFAMEYIKQFCDLNQNLNLFGDEHYVAIIRAQTELAPYLSTINNKYNVGKTHFEDRYNAAEKPICVIGIKPSHENEMNPFYVNGLINKDLNLIFNKYFNKESCMNILSNIPDNREHKNKKVFIDAGANIGQSIENFIKNWQNWREFEIHSFEANPRLVRYFDKYKDIENINFYNKAVWINDGSVEFYLCNSGNCSSSVVGSKITGNLDKIPTIIPCIDISNFIKNRYKKEDYIILKIDIEGGEYELVQHMIDNKTFEYVDVLYIEFHNRKVGKTKQDDEFLLNEMHKFTNMEVHHETYNGLNFL